MSDKRDEREKPAASSSILGSVKASLGLLTPEQRRRYWLLVVAQASLAFLDLGGVFLLGFVAYLFTASLTNGELPPMVENVLTRIGLEELSLGATVTVLTVVAAILLIARSIFSLVIYRWIVLYLARTQVQLSSSLTRKILDSPITFLQQRSTSEFNYAAIDGPGFVVTGNLASVASIISEFFLFLVLFIGLLQINPATTLFMTLVFIIIAISFHRLIAKRSYHLGQLQGGYAIASLRAFHETLGAYREILVSGRKEAFRDALMETIKPLAIVNSRLQLLFYTPKTVYEIVLVLGILLLLGWELTRNNPDLAVASIAIFMAASARILPAMQRTNALLSGLKAGAGMAEPTYQLSQDIKNGSLTGTAAQNEQIRLKAPSTQTARGFVFEPSVKFSGVRYSYPGKKTPAISLDTLCLKSALSHAIVGRTGSGKSTLVDLMLGILQPDEGSVYVSSIPPLEAIKVWPGRIGYVPQHVALFDSTVERNVTLNLDASLYDERDVWNALRIASLDAFIQSQPAGLRTEIGERGFRLSGGQRQRLGLARAVFSRPKLLVLDEATSSIDTETEHAIIKALASLAGETTIVTIAHRLSTVRRADQVVYLEAGRVVCAGTFEEVRLEVPQFELQAQLAGL